MRQGSVPRLRALGTVIVLFATSTSLAAQDPSEESDKTSGQLWLAFRMIKPLENKQWVMHFDARTNGDQGDRTFGSLAGRTRVNFYVLSWLDLSPEILLRYTHQREDLNTFTTALRGGIRFRLPHVQRVLNRERVPLQRLDFAVLLRMEWRNVQFDGGGSDSSWRARGRVEARFPLNRDNMTVDKTVYLRGDAEAFVPLGDELPETFANRWRFRAGAGYRFSFAWRIEALGIWQTSRNTLEDDFGTTEFILNLRLNHYFQ